MCRPTSMTSTAMPIKKIEDEQSKHKITEQDSEKNLIEPKNKVISLEEMQTAAMLGIAASFLLVEGGTRVTLRVTQGLKHGWTAGEENGVVFFPEAALLAASVAE
eukprot:Awhi_evm1s2242